MPARRPARSRASRGVITNVTTDPARSRQGLGSLRGGRLPAARRGVILFTDSIYAIATAKSERRRRRRSSSASGCKVLEVVDTPIGDLGNRMGQLTTSLLSKYGDKWTYSDRRERPLLRLLGALAAVRRRRSRRRAIRADLRRRRFRPGVPAHPRRASIQVATVAEPLYLHGWQIVDELNRAFAGEAPSGYVAPPHLFVAVEHRQGRRRPRTASTPATATATSTRRSGASVVRAESGHARE